MSSSLIVPITRIIFADLLNVSASVSVFNHSYA